MAPQSKNDAQQILRTVWENNPEADFGCLVIDFLSAHGDSVHIPFAQFFEIARANQVGDNNVVLNVVNYLTGSHLKLLKTSFEYIDGETVTLLDSSQVRAAKQNKINPITGGEDKEVGEKIFVYFLPTELARRALSK
jgi:hypothetical protein